MEARKSGALEVFTAKVQASIAPLLLGVGEYDSAERISSEITQVARMITKTAEELLLCVKPRRLPQFRDEDLSHLCAQGRAACAAWRDAGSPPDGPLYEEKN